MRGQSLVNSTSAKVVSADSLLIGNRIPKDYFVCTGKGESDIAIHAGSYHLALKDAGIEKYNIMTYSSILPDIANRVEKPENVRHGSVMETIMSVCHSEKGVRATAGITYGWLYDKKTGQRHGGLVCENYGHESVEEIQKILRMSLDELYFNGFSDDFDLKDIEFFSESFIPEKKYGAALVAICFTSYEFPILNR